MYGHLFAILGNSSVNKDCLLSYIKDNAETELNLVFPKYWISLQPGNESQDYYPLPLDHFVDRIKAGDFLVWGEAEGLLFGIEKELDELLVTGKNILITVPLTAIPELRQHFPEITVIILPEKFQFKTGFPGETGQAVTGKNPLNFWHNEIILPEDADVEKWGLKLLTIIRTVIKNPKTLEVTILGDTPPMPGTNNSSFMVQHTTGDLLIDATPGLVKSFSEKRFDLQRLLGIVITHDHIEHFLGLGAFLHCFRDVRMDLPIFAPLQTLATLRSYFATLRFKRRSIAIKLHLNPVTLFSGYLMTDLPGLELTACPTSHSRDTIAIGIKERRSGTKVVFSSDTCPSEAIAKFSTQADLLFHDCLGSHKYQQVFAGSHSSSLQAGQIAQVAMAKRLVLTHIDPRYYTLEEELSLEAKEAFAGQVFTARYGQIYTA